MRRPNLGMPLIGAACLILVLPASVLAIPRVGEKSNGFSKTDERALHVYIDCWDQFKSRCGRNIVDDGVISGKPPSVKQVRDWTATMNRWLNPPEPVAMSSPATTSQVAPTPATASVAPASAGGCVGMDAESGSLGYAEPGGDGYVGCYQISEDHFNGGSCSGMSTDPAGQDACAAVICQTEGTGAWTNPSGQNPCGRLGG